MPSSKSLGAFEELKGPVPSAYGDWSRRWEQSELRYVPPHRPLARLAADLGPERPSVRALQTSVRALKLEASSDPRFMYRLPGFNVHRPELNPAIAGLHGPAATDPAHKPPILGTLTAWQTPKEAAALAHAQSLKQRSTAAASDVTRTLTSKPQLSLDLGSFASYLGGLERSYDLRPLRDSAHQQGSAAVDESPVDDLWPADASLVDDNVAELLRHTPRVMAPAPFASASPGGGSVGSGRSGASDDASGASRTSSALYALEASGTGQVWVPANRMPAKPYQRFATYPALAVDFRGGLKRRGAGLAIPAGAVGWPAEAPHALVEPTRSLKPRGKAPSRAVAKVHPQGRPRVYPGVEPAPSGASGVVKLATAGLSGVRSGSGSGISISSSSSGGGVGETRGAAAAPATTSAKGREAQPRREPAAAMAAEPQGPAEPTPRTPAPFAAKSAARSAEATSVKHTQLSGTMGSYARARRSQIKGK
jgi:hypothetical protein